MHIHHNLFANPIGVRPADATAKTAALQRTIQTRKRLLKSASEINAQPDFGRWLMVDHAAQGEPQPDKNQKTYLYPVPDETDPPEKTKGGSASFWA